MLKNTLAAALAFTVFTVLAASPVLAEETQAAPKDKPVQGALSYLRFASVTEPGELIKAGDVIKIQRAFSSWTLRCDVRLSKNRRACFVEQRGETTEGALVWRVGMNTDNKPVVVIALPANFDADKGLRIKFSGLEKTVTRENFACSPQSCIGGFLFEGFVQAAITKAPDIGFEVPRVNAEPISLQLSMAGFTEALDAAARDPFGRDVSSKVARQMPANAKPVKASVTTLETRQTRLKGKPKTRRNPSRPSTPKYSGLF